MPSAPAGIPEVVIGDRHGRTAAPWVSAAAAEIARGAGFSAGLNDPFAGGHVIASHARPGYGVHAIQLELDRSCYLDSSLRRPGAGFDHSALLLDGIATKLGETLLQRRFAVAAE
jgi:N-formylglutamate amidohydrolase